MYRIELADTLLALVGGIDATLSGMSITEASLEVPMEVISVVEDGKLIFFAAPPHTRFISGVLPAVHRTTLRLELADDLDGGNL